MATIASTAIPTLLKNCWKLGIELTVNGDNLAFKAPEGAMNDTLLQQIKAAKPALIELLTEQADYYQTRPLSDNERALWFLYRLNPTSVAYNMAWAIQLKNHYSDEDIQFAFSQLLQTYPQLNCNYGERDGEPFQWLNGSQQSAVAIIEAADASELRIKQWVNQQADQQLAPDAGKTCVASVLKVGENCYLSIVVHHIAADFISFELLRRDLLRLLNKSAPVTRQYPDYDYQQWTLNQQTQTKPQDQAYWLQTLAGLPQLQLPTDFVHQPNLESAGAEIQQTLAPALSQQLRQACQMQSVTPYVWWMAAFQWFMSRLSGQSDFVIGTPAAGRLTPQDNELVGYLVNPVALRCQTDQQQLFSQWLVKVNQQIQQMVKHQAYPFATLMDNLTDKPEVNRTAGRNPVFQHMFTLNQLHHNSLDQQLIERELLAEQRGAAHELNLVVVDDKSDFVCKWRYNNSLYKPATVERIQTMFFHVVDQLLTNQHLLLDQLSMGPQSLQSVLKGPSQPALAATASQAFADNVAASPQAIAISSEGLKISYSDLFGQVEQQANRLVEQGFGANKRLGIHLPRGVKQVVLMLASWRLGGSFVVLDTQWPQARIDYIVKDAGLALVISNDHLTSTSGAYTYSSEQVSNQPEDEAYCIYTSGSTGNPKAVCISQSNLVHYVSGVMPQLGLTANASMASLSNHSADLGYTALFGALLTGRCLRLLAESLALDSQALVSALKAEPVDCLKIVPSHLNGLLLAEQQDALEILPQQVLICGGEAFSPQLFNRIRAQKPALAIFNHYGPSETTIGVLLNKLTGDDADSIALGQPMANMTVRVVDSAGHHQIEGFPGELHISGPTVAAGYLNQIKLNQQQFYQYQGKRWYRSGDSVVMHGQQLHYLGRNDSQVKIRGYRVELGEIEHWLKQHVSDAVVLNITNAQGKNSLVAYLVSEQQLEVIQQLAAQALPDYMQPADWVLLEALPRLANGKIDKKALPACSEKPTATSVQNRVLNPTETVLLEIWRQMLGKPELSVDDDFFASGGDSILSLQVVAKARSHNIQILPKDIFAYKTIAALAAALALKQQPVQPIAQTSLTQQSFALTPIQHWLLEQKLDNPGHWNQSILLKAPNGLNIEALVTATDAILAHHASLRLAFSQNQTQSSWSQHYQDYQSHWAADVVKVIDAQVDDELLTLVQGDFDLAAAPLLRFVWFAQSNTLLLAAHHLIVDAVSWRIIVDDLLKAYHQQSLDPVSTEFADWQQLLAQTAIEDIDNKRQYWMQQLSVTAISQVDNRYGNSRHHRMGFDESITSALIHQSNQPYHTRVQELLICALVRTLSQWLNLTQITIELEGHGREALTADIDLSRSIGWFTCRYPQKFTTSDSLEQAIIDTKEQLRNVPDHGLSYGMIRYGAQPLPQTQEWGHSSLVSFNYLGQQPQLDDQAFQLIPAMCVGMRGAQNQRPHLLDINAIIVNGSLQVDWCYPNNHPVFNTLPEVAVAFDQQVKAIVRHCSNQANGRATGSDFPHAGIDDAAFVSLLAELQS
ncbi:MAG: amino acid adenylation domain-containing protein [Phenylobacterium sp.]|jgi:amino acid adenylation domain-containing protein/non-ribosomal peptide synthase protein (TIGR01720 family)